MKCVRVTPTSRRCNRGVVTGRRGEWSGPVRAAAIPVSTVALLDLDRSGAVDKEVPAAKVIRGDVGRLRAAHRLDVVDDLSPTGHLNEVLVVRLRRRNLVLVQAEHVNRSLSPVLAVRDVLGNLLLALPVRPVVER